MTTITEKFVKEVLVDRECFGQDISLYACNLDILETHPHLISSLTLNDYPRPEEILEAASPGIYDELYDRGLRTDIADENMVKYLVSGKVSHATIGKIMLHQGKGFLVSCLDMLGILLKAQFHVDKRAQDYVIDWLIKLVVAILSVPAETNHLPINYTTLAHIIKEEIKKFNDNRYTVTYMHAVQITYCSYGLTILDETEREYVNALADRIGNIDPLKPMIEQLNPMFD